MAHPIVHAHGLFRSLAPGERKQKKLDVTFTIEETSFRFMGFEPLDSRDLQVLQAIVALSTEGLRNVKGMLSDAAPIRSLLALTGDASSAPTVAAPLTLAKLAETAGFEKNCGFSYQKMRASLVRLANVTVLVKKPDFEGSYHLIAGHDIESRTGRLSIVLSPLATAAVLGRNGFLSTNMDEVRSLKSGAAHILHNRLHWINQGCRRKVGMQTLCSYIYGDGEAPSIVAQRKRQQSVRRALAELPGIGWAVVETEPSMFTISRPARGKTTFRDAKKPEELVS
ncbi:MULTISPECIES: replication protein C, IncQ-type [Achromobacter]|uniref:Replication protein C, IncQ-type n=1 Tax=Achromobacter spanius TaxID=217203 RepID=A0ABY8GM81_9BURK|nr:MULTISPECIES: replication protein C, IncQ-type [Achromobacter]WAI84813.1 replication protein C, IncQ-type [Achromobacter spanius]WEX94896.1 replication protein C, IncQ-type [Achromobacter sp. SS2-2022]WFP05936.1 replication protein C, IncQ-type [Achromobacter spanius]